MVLFIVTTHFRWWITLWDLVINNKADYLNNWYPNTRLFKWIVYWSHSSAALDALLLKLMFNYLTWYPEVTIVLYFQVFNTPYGVQKYFFEHMFPYFRIFLCYNVYLKWIDNKGKHRDEIKFKLYARIFSKVFHLGVTILNRHVLI